MDDQPPYRVVPDSDQFQVTDDDDRVIMTCRDNRSAEHYAALLTQAFRRGYRAGYRDSTAARE